MTKLTELDTGYGINWCPGCGNMAIWGAFRNAAVKEGWDNTNTALVAGIGCHGHIVNFLKLTSVEGLHGRALPIATGIKIANNRLNVFVFSGDGDCLGEGGNHLIHTCRRNHDLTLILHDNGLYALTTGQTSPASPHGFKSKSTPAGNPDNPFMPLALAIASGATFAARAYAGDIPKLTEIIIQANKHKGFSIVEVMQPCVTFNKINTHQMYQENTYWLGNDYDKTNKEAAIMKAYEWGQKSIPLGILYEVESPSYESGIPQIQEKPLIEHTKEAVDINEILKKYL